MEKLNSIVMQKIFFILLVTLVACKGFVINEDESKKTAGALLMALQNEDFEKTSDYYSPEFNAGEPLELRSEKYLKLKEACGKRISYELIESTKKTIDERDVFLLTYKIQCENVVLKEVLIVGLEEGKHLVLLHTISNEDTPEKK